VFAHPGRGNSEAGRPPSRDQPSAPGVGISRFLTGLRQPEKQQKINVGIPHIHGISGRTNFGALIRVCLGVYVLCAAQMMVPA
jgi:hypothetical protein